MLDKKAVTSEPAPLVWAQVIRVLTEMGIEMKRDKEFRLKCTRSKRAAAAWAKSRESAGGLAGLGLAGGVMGGMDKGSVMSSFSMMGGASSSMVCILCFDRFLIVGCLSVSFSKRHVLPV